MIKAVIMAGGSGTRLWPLSRAAHPKQFLTLHGDDTMLQATFKRLDGLDIQSSVTICNEEHRFFVAEQLREIDRLGSIILEPVGRNTAPAIALAALSLPEGEDPLLLVLAADHVIQNEAAFTKTVMNAIPLAEAGKLVTFGIVAQEPNTGYGYIKRGQSQGPGFAVDAFVEKPSIEIAKEYLESGDYFWNSGMFLFKASRYLEELKKHRPDIYEACQLSMEGTSKDNDFLRINQAAFSACPSDSIDYAVMEKTDKACVVSVSMGWSDVGSWQVLWEIGDKDDAGNVISGDVMQVSSKNCYLRSDGTLVAAIGLEDFVVVASTDAVLVAPKGEVQQVRDIVEQLGKDGRTEGVTFPEVYRPWGCYKTLNKGPGFNVNRITLHAGGRVNLRRHRHTAQHWAIIDGTANVTLDDTLQVLEPGQSISIPAGAAHALATSENQSLSLIEVQAGPNAGKDEFERLEYA